MGSQDFRHNTISLTLGFTLIELLISLSIIAILGSLIVISLRAQLFKGNDARRKADIDQIKVAVEEYEKDHNCYPAPAVLTCKPGSGLEPYLIKIPCDPITDASYYYETENNLCPSWYKLYTILQYTKDSSVTPGIGPGSIYNYVSGSANAPN
jgi:prepilin-type N-terminal cleavage/methylation domain-containing protein